MKRLPVSVLVWVSVIGGGIGAGEWWQAGKREPSLDPVLGRNADVSWSRVSGSFTISPDPALGREVLTAEKQQLLVLEGLTRYTGAIELKALVRLRTDAAPYAGAGFFLGRKDANDPGFQINLSATRASEAVSCTVAQSGKPLHDTAALAKQLDWTPQVSMSFTYHLRAYTRIEPGWREDYRRLIEHDMAALPDHNRKWLSVRVELAKGRVGFWLDDRCVAEKKDAEIAPEGTARIELGPGVQLGQFSIERLVETPGFLPIRLEGYTNARTFLRSEAVDPASLPPLDEVVHLNGVPFVFPAMNAEGNDHIDVGRSLYRDANNDGYLPSYGPRWAGSTLRDPARIQLRIPNGQYDTLYLIAAADEEKDSVPLVSAMFFRPSAGFAETFEAAVPRASDRSVADGSLQPAAACYTPLPVRLTNGKKANLWLVAIPLDPGRLSSFADLDIVEIELTKKVRQFRSYPDPFIYGWHQAGLPSAVHIYAATLAKVPVGFELQPDKFGHVWTAPEVPSYTVTLTNNTDSPVAGKLAVFSRSYDLTDETIIGKPLALARGQTLKVPIQLPVKLNGYHELTAILEIAGKKWTEKRSFVRLAPDTRSPRWEEGKGALFGYWSYHGGHHTPKADHHINLMTIAGARTSIGLASKDNPLVQKHWTRVPCGAWEVSPQAWAAEDPYDPKKYEEYQKTVVEAYSKARAAVPEPFQPDHVYFFPEPCISLRLTAGNFPSYWGEPEYELTPDEQRALRMYMVTAKCAAEAVRKTWPNLKILIPWGDPLFIVPLLRAGFPKELIDGSGLDICHFERLPEQQLHQISVHRLYELRKEYEKAGIPNPVLQYCEGIFVPTEVGACSWREQMDIYHRWTLISMAYGIERFYSGWFAFDAASYYGSEHYGGCGIQRRIPYCDPKPAYAAYATMTDKLNEANFDGWLRTGSLTTYCLRFKGPKGFVYALWTLRGKRQVTLNLAADAQAGVTDSMNNTKLLTSKDKKLTLTTDPSVIYVTGAGEVASVEVGPVDHADSLPPDGARLLADLGDGTWHYSSKRELTYETNNFDTFRYLGKFSAAVVEDAERGKVLASKLEKQDKVHELMPWYNTLAPRRPVALPGAPAALGLWVKGASDWGRVIYCLRDAKGERWLSIGTKDQWNCDDVHSWSYFNFDGWRYLRFELPGHTGYDSFRKHGTTWWLSVGGDTIVDLPLELEQIIVEQRTHILYVNDVQPVASDTVCFGKLYAEYESPTDATAAAVKESRIRMPLPKDLPDLPNPIKEMDSAGGTGAVPTITKLVPPDHSDGTSVHVHFDEAPGAKAHFVWIAAYPDGRGAVNATPQGAKSGILVHGLRPAAPFYFWVVAEGADGKLSKPSNVVAATLVDTFKEK